MVHDLRALWFLEKPTQAAVLASLLERAVNHQGLVEQTARLQRQLGYQGFVRIWWGRLRRCAKCSRSFNKWRPARLRC